jgi:hypothetical protein
METQLIQKFLAKTGQICKVTWRRECKTRKGSPVVHKTVTAIVRAGIDYDNQKIVQNKRENGELPKENAGLPWGEWFIFPYIVKHKENFYLRFYPFNGGKVLTKFELDGNTVEFDRVKDYLLSSEKQEREGDCFVVKENSILALE